VTHPDKFLEPGASEEEIQDASDRFHQIRQAFDILNDPRKRKVSV
jgi:DnaJ-class molecular chaperone